MNDPTSSPASASHGIEPVRHRIDVPLDAADAFALFTSSIARWWPFRDHSCSGERAVDVEFEPRVGGAVVEVSRDGERHRWGTVTRWEPPSAFAMTWHPGQPETAATQLRVHFAARGGGCELQLEHDGWHARGSAAGVARGNYERGWPVVLGCYAAAAASQR